VWEASKNNDPLTLPEDIETDVGLFQKIVDSKISIAEMVDFVFVLENVSIAFREQMVRHRIGVKQDDRVGVDVVPNLADSSFWGQSMRILDLSKFAENGYYEIPESVRKREDSRVLYEDMMFCLEETYNKLIQMGIPTEDARMVLPLATTQRITWKLNLSSILHIVGKRGCWIPQLGFWGPVIKGMVRELKEKVHPMFAGIIAPPCMSGGKFKQCLFKLDNERRIRGEDETTPCPLYLREHLDEALEASKNRLMNGEDWICYDKSGWSCNNYHKEDLWFERRKEYEALWGFSTCTSSKEM